LPQSFASRALADLLRARRRDSWYYFTLPSDHHDFPTKGFELDIKALTIDTPNLVSKLGPAFEKYNEEQFTTVKLPGSSQNVSLGSKIGFQGNANKAYRRL
jgi:hypothetical protein